MMQVDKSYTGASFASYLGPYTLLRSNADVGVIRHETGHIFGGYDQYPAGTWPTTLGGYLSVLNANTQRNTGAGFFSGQGEGVIDIMVAPSSPLFSVYTRGQLGWRDVDGDGILDPCDTIPQTRLDPHQGGSQLSFTGVAEDRPLSNALESEFVGDATINTIRGVSYRIDGSSWIDANPTDGLFDARVEEFTFVTPELPDGTHLIEVRATNSVGNVESGGARAVVEVLGSAVMNLAPFATFTVSPETGSSTALFTLDGSASSDLEDPAATLEVRWDIEGDGSWDTPWSTTKILSDVSYPGNTLQTPTLEVRDSALATATASRSVSVTNFNLAPTAVFTASPENQVGPPDKSEPYFEVLLDASGSSDPESPIVYRWDFEDDGVWDTAYSSSATIVQRYDLALGSPSLARIELNPIPQAVAVSGTTAFVTGSNTGLYALDVSDPTTPVVVGNDPTTCCGWDLALSGNLLFVADGAQGLKIFDVSDPTDLQQIGVYDTPGAVQGVAVSDDIAYVADNNPGMKIIDVSDPTDPVLLGSYDTAGVASGIAVYRRHAYVLSGTQGMQVVDVSDPANPTLTDTLSAASSEALGIEFEGTSAYLGFGLAGLTVLDVTIPGSPVVVGGVQLGPKAVAVTVEADTVYVTTDGSSVEVIDVSVPSAPVRQETIDVFGTDDSRGLVVQGSLLYLAIESGFQIIDLAGEPVFYPQSLHRRIRLEVKDTPNERLAQATRDVWAVTYDHSPTIGDFAWRSSSSALVPTIIGAEPTGLATDLKLDGGYAYAAANIEGLQVLDVSDPTSPLLVGGYLTSSRVVGVAVQAGVAYLADAFDGLTILDVSDPQNPTFLGNYPLPGYSSSVAIVGNTAYVGGEGLAILDVTDPSAPVLLGSEPNAGFVGDIELLGDYAYVASHALGLIVVDVSDPAAPVMVASHVTGDARGVALYGGKVFLATGPFGLLSFDLTDPSTPVLLATFDTPGLASKVAIEDGLAYVADYDWGLQILDVTDPERPIYAGGFDPPGDMLAISVSQGIAYTSGNLEGFVLFETREAQAHVFALTAFDDLDLAESWDGYIRYRVDMGSDGIWDTTYTACDELARAVYILPPGIDTLPVTCAIRDRFGGVDELEYVFELDASGCVSASTTSGLRWNACLRTGGWRAVDYEPASAATRPLAKRP